MSNKGLLVVISGPSGVGKGTICKRLLERDDMVLSVSATTRKIGKGEENGKSYWFMTRDEFENKIKSGGFLEYAEVFGNYYGTPADKVRQALEAGKTVLLEIDVQGGLQVKKNMPETLMIFVEPPSEEELERRIRKRGRDTDDVIAKRLSKAQLETDIAKDNYEYFVVNDTLERAVNEVLSIIQDRRNDK